MKTFCASGGQIQMYHVLGCFAAGGLVHFTKQIHEVEGTVCGTEVVSYYQAQASRDQALDLELDLVLK